MSEKRDPLGSISPAGSGGLRRTNNSMKKLLSLCAAILCHAAVISNLAAADAPTVDSILEKNAAAIGGKAAMEKFKTRITIGAVSAMGNDSTWEQHAKAPNKVGSRVEITGLGVISDACDGTNAWTKNPEGVQEKAGAELAKIKADSDFYHDLNLKTLYPNLAYKGAEKLDAEEVQVLEAKPSEGSKERFYFSSKTGSLLRQMSEFSNDSAKISIDVRFEDFRAVDGVKYPFVRKYGIFADGNPVFDFVLKIKEIKHNVPVDEKKFQKPAA
jgi:hypothetical protein